MKKITKLLLLVTTIVVFTVLLAISAFAEIITGNCGVDGDNVTYKLDTETGVLEIMGTGEMANYLTQYNSDFYSTAPWGTLSLRNYVKKVVISQGITSIGSSGFSMCSNITSITIPNSINGVGNGAFMGCQSLKNVYISSIESWLNIKFGNGLSQPLYWGGKLYINGIFETGVIILDGVTNICEYSFFNYDNLTTITFETKDVTISSTAFNNCDNLHTIFCYIGSTADEYFSADLYTKIYLDNFKDSDFAYSINDDGITITIKDYLGTGGSGLIPSIIDGYIVTNIGEMAFKECNKISSVIIPNGITSIGMEAFSCCGELINVTIPNSVTNIGFSALYNINNLKNIYVYKNSYAEEFCLADETLINKIRYIPTEADSFMSFDGYQVREDEYNGLRSRFVVDLNAMPTLENGGFEVVEVGAIFAATDKLTASGDEFIIARGEDGTYKTVSYGVTVPVMKNGAIVGKYISKTEDELVFACTITNFNAENYNKNVSSRGYAVLADADGNEYVVYCDYEFEEYRSVSLEMICDALFEAGEISADNISYTHVVAFRKED